MIFEPSLAGAGFTQLLAVYLCVFLILITQRETILLSCSGDTQESEKSWGGGAIIKKKMCGKKGTSNMVLHMHEMPPKGTDSTVIY